MIPSKRTILSAYEQIKPFVHHTPVITSSLLNELSGASVFFKCENFQKMGAFKMRGALHAILNLSEEQKKCGVVTHSSGNFGQAVALSSRILGVTSHIVMPSNAPEVKKRAVEQYGGIIIESGPQIKDREIECQRVQKENNATFLHPSNDLDVIIGNATSAYELLAQYPDLDIIFVPVGGGGLIAGTALSAFYFGNSCQVIGGEPFQADDAYRSLQTGKIETNASAETVADGLRTHLGDKNFPIIRQLVSEIIRVEEMEILAAMRLIWERMKIIIEPSSAVPFAAILKEKERFVSKKIGVIVSGGNVDLSMLPF